MDIRRTYINDSGRNGEGNNWSVSLEMPYFDDTELDSFYNEMADRIRSRAEYEGYSAFSYLCITRVADDSFSLYLDILFCRKRELYGLYRICDNRKNGFEIPMPKKLKRRGYDCFCQSGNGILAFKNHFHVGSEAAKRKDYQLFIENAEL